MRGRERRGHVVEPDAHELGARLEQLHPLRQRARPLVERRGQLLEGSDGVVGLQLVLALQDLQGEEAGRQVEQAQQGDGEAQGVGVGAQFADLSGQRPELLDALQDEGVDPLVALAHLLRSAGLARPANPLRLAALSRAVVRSGAGGVPDRVPQARAQPAQARREVVDLRGAASEQRHDPGALVEQRDLPGRQRLDAVHLVQDDGDGPLGVGPLRDVDAGGHEGGDLGGQGLAGEVDGVAEAQRVEFGQQRRVPGRGGLAPGRSAVRRGPLDGAHAPVGGLDLIAPPREHGQGAHGEVAVAGGDDRGEDAVEAAVGGAVGDVGAGRAALLEVLPDGAEEAGGHGLVAHGAVGAPHEGAARVPGQAHEDGVGPADAPPGVRGGEEQLVGGVGVLDSRRGGAADGVGGFGGIRGLRRGGDPGGGGGLGGLGHGRPSLAAGQLRSRAGPGSAPPTGPDGSA